MQTSSVSSSQILDLPERLQQHTHTQTKRQTDRQTDRGIGAKKNYTAVMRAIQRNISVKPKWVLSRANVVCTAMLRINSPMAWKSASSPLTGCTACETSKANALSATIAAFLARSAAFLPACLPACFNTAVVEKKKIERI